MAHLTLADHEALARALLEARALLAVVTSTLRAAYPKHIAPPLHHGLGACLRELDAAREALAAVLHDEHGYVHPASGKRIYFPTVDGPAGAAAPATAGRRNP